MRKVSKRMKIWDCRGEEQDLSTRQLLRWRTTTLTKWSHHLKMRRHLPQSLWLMLTCRVRLMKEDLVRKTKEESPRQNQLRKAEAVINPMMKRTTSVSLKMRRTMMTWTPLMRKRAMRNQQRGRSHLPGNQTLRAAGLSQADRVREPASEGRQGHLLALLGSRKRKKKKKKRKRSQHQRRGTRDRANPRLRKEWRLTKRTQLMQ